MNNSSCACFFALFSMLIYSQRLMEWFLIGMEITERKMREVKVILIIERISMKRLKRGLSWRVVAGVLKGVHEVSTSISLVFKRNLEITLFKIISLFLKSGVWIWTLFVNICHPTIQLYRHLTVLLLNSNHIKFERPSRTGPLTRVLLRFAYIGVRWVSFQPD